MNSAGWEFVANTVLFFLLVAEVLSHVIATGEYQWWKYLLIFLTDTMTVVVFVFEKQNSLLAAYIILILIQSNPSQRFRNYAILVYTALAPTVFFVLTSTVLTLRMEEQIGFEALMFLTFEWGCVFLFIVTVLFQNRAINLNFGIVALLAVANLIYVHNFALTENSKSDLAWYYYSSLGIAAAPICIMLYNYVSKSIVPSPLAAEFYIGGCLICVLSVTVNFMRHPAFASFGLHYSMLLFGVRFDEVADRKPDEAATLLNNSTEMEYRSSDKDDLVADDADPGEEA